MRQVDTHKIKSAHNHWMKYVQDVLVILACLVQTLHAAPLDDFVTTWKTNNYGGPLDTSITIPMIGGPYDVDWDNDGIFDEIGVSSSVDHDFGTNGVYTIRIRGTYDGISSSPSKGAEDLLTLDQWGTNTWKTMRYAFYGAKNLRIVATDTPDFSNLTSMHAMFLNASAANPDTSNWNTSSVTDMSSVFNGATSANPDTSNWDTSSVTDMNRMFVHAYVARPDTSNWDTSNVTNMYGMFYKANNANPDISSWETSSVTDMSSMFVLAPSIDQHLGLLDISSVTDMESMFWGSVLTVQQYDELLISWASQSVQPNVKFHGGESNYCSLAAITARDDLIINQKWEITDGGQACPPSAPALAPDLIPSSDSGVSDNDNITDINTAEFYVLCTAIGNSILLYSNNPAEKTLVGKYLCQTTGIEIAKAEAPLHDGIHSIYYTDKILSAESAPSPILDITIINSAPQPKADFVTTWKTDNLGLSSNTSIVLPMVGGPYNVDWDNDGYFDEYGLSGLSTHDYGIAGTYTIRVRGGHDSIRFGIFSDDKEKIIRLDQWGTHQWTTMHAAFDGTYNLTIPATDIPDFSAMTSMQIMFRKALLADPDTSNWDTSTITTMSSMFRQAENANPDTSGWDTSSVNSMYGMFARTNMANPDTSGWDTSAVTNMADMFASALVANPDTSGWDTSEVTEMWWMFFNAGIANPDVANWDTARVTDMAAMFISATRANPDVSNWDTSAVVTMDAMFSNALSAEPDTSLWDVSSLETAQSMFENITLSPARYDSLLTGWAAQNLKPTVKFSAGNSVYCSNLAIKARTELTEKNKWVITDGGLGSVTCPVPSTPLTAPDLTPDTDTGISNEDNITADNTPAFFINCSKYGNSIRVYTDNPNSSTLIAKFDCLHATIATVPIFVPMLTGTQTIFYTDSFGVNESAASPSLAITITNAAPEPAEDFVTTWRSYGDPITIPIVGGPYAVDWNNDGVFDEFGLVDSVSHEYQTNIAHTIRIRGSFDSFYYPLVAYSPADSHIVSVDQWGTNRWKTMYRAFMAANELVVTAQDIPDFSLVNDMSYMFNYSGQSNPNTTNWNTSSVTNMEAMFESALTTTPDVSKWDTSSVTNMSLLFYRSYSVNPDVSGWDTSNVTDMTGMFSQARSFNRDISSWDVTQLKSATYMLSGSGMTTENYDALLVGWALQNLQPNVRYFGANSLKYCSAAAISARLKIVTVDGWSILDSGVCPSPAIPDLTATADTGNSNTDNITANKTPEFKVTCSALGNTITLYTDNPSSNTAISSHLCSTAGIEHTIVNTPLQEGVHNISNTDTFSGIETPKSGTLLITIDTIPPIGPGALSNPLTPTNNVNSNIVGNCGIDVGNGMAWVTTTPTNGFSLNYNTPTLLSSTGSLILENPFWEDGNFTLSIHCKDAAGNGPTNMGPFGPIEINLPCSGEDLTVVGDFSAGMHRCTGLYSLITSGNVTLESGAIVYFQSPEVDLHMGFEVQLGASYTITSDISNLPPHMTGPDEISASIGDTVIFSNTHSCEDFEDGPLTVFPIDSGVLTGPVRTAIYTLHCTDAEILTTQQQLNIIIQ